MVVSCHTIVEVSSVEVDCIGSGLVDTVVKAVGVGVGAGSLLPGP